MGSPDQESEAVEVLLSGPRTFMSRWFPILLWIAAIYAGSSRSVLPWPLSGNSFAAQLVRKAIHPIEYAGLATLLCRALGGNLSIFRNPDTHKQDDSLGKDTPLRSSHKVLVAAFVLATVHGFLDEWHQSFVPGRNPSLWDVGLDAIGAGAALAVVATVGGLKNRPVSRAHGDPGL